MPLQGHLLTARIIDIGTTPVSQNSKCCEKVFFCEKKMSDEDISHWIKKQNLNGNYALTPNLLRTSLGIGYNRGKQLFYVLYKNCFDFVSETILAGDQNSKLFVKLIFEKNHGYIAVIKHPLYFLSRK